MDTKALAKSKRAHSQHHSKSKRPPPNQASKVPSVVATASAGNTQKPSGKQTREKSRQSHGSTTALPSNWDRYDEEEFDLGSEDLSLGSTSGASDVVAPHSKGADYGYLISQAQSQLQSQYDPDPDGLALFHDTFPDFNQGRSSMLSIKGNRILSWIRDDAFIVDENVTTSYEAPFLSLDLHTLAGQLEKIDISERLFIEPGLLPPELETEGSKESNRLESDHFETACESEVAESRSDKLYHERADGEMVVDYKNDTPATTSSEHPGPLLTHERALSINPVNIDSSLSEQTDTTEVIGSISRLSLSSMDSNKKSSRFEAAVAEAELDLLLDSLGDSQFLDHSGLHDEISNSIPVVGQEPSTSSLGVTPVQAQVVLKSIPVTVNLDDAVDDLLWGASSPRNQDKLPKPQRDLHSTTFVSGSNSKVLEDFDSWLDTI
ncbi:hypothetical protein NE237_032569 [Protea cynaroides]|uniref:Uncharacterized protein n=1 Tax=Protea cynaroides TaxID=273540 RepID=A0A9Q0R3L2_9MAGN|nr:hypothetical protein NE237_032569 [Protea cynaroides]